MLNWNRTLAASVDEVEAFCLALREELYGHWHRSDVFAAELVFREVLANAVEHGARFDPRQTISVDLSVENGRLRARISDTGPGFDPAPPPDFAEHGRGLQILALYAPVYTFGDRGRTVEFELTLRPQVEQKE